MNDVSQSKNSSSTAIITVVVLVLVALGAAFYFLRDKEPDAASVQPVTIPESSVATSEAAVAPIPTYEPPAPEIKEKPLPLLNDSDTSVLAALKKLGGDGLLNLLVPQELIRKFVLAVNNIAEGKVVYEYRPVVSPAPPFVVETVEVDGLESDVDADVDMVDEPQNRVSANNYPRYTPYVSALALVDPAVAASVYRRFYPLMTEAFNELGLKKPNFHSLMIAAIDNILAAPDAPSELLVVRPKVFYQYADPSLEKLPQTHKLMLRMGPENARSVKASLRALRAELLKVKE